MVSSCVGLQTGVGLCELQPDVVLQTCVVLQTGVGLCGLPDWFGLADWFVFCRPVWDFRLGWACVCIILVWVYRLVCLWELVWTCVCFRILSGCVCFQTGVDLYELADWCCLADWFVLTDLWGFMWCFGFL